ARACERRDYRIKDPNELSAIDASPISHRNVTCCRSICVVRAFAQRNKMGLMAVRGSVAKAERSIMTWTKVTKSPSCDDCGNDDAAVLSRRRVLAGIGFAGLLAVAGSRLLVSSPAEARSDTPVRQPEAAPTDAAKGEAAERAPEGNRAILARGGATEFSSQSWRRRRRRYWRRRSRWRRRYYRRGYYWRRRYWRRRYYRPYYYY